MEYFQTKNPNLGKLSRVLQWKMFVYILYVHLVYFTANWCILWSFGIDCGHLVYFTPFDMFNQGKIGNPNVQHCPFGILYSNLPHFMAIRFIFWLLFGIFCPVLVFCSKKIWQPWWQNVVHYPPQKTILSLVRIMCTLWGDDEL
jgi:hypothetical protein